MTTLTRKKKTACRSMEYEIQSSLHNFKQEKKIDRQWKDQYHIHLDLTFLFSGLLAM